MDIEAKRKSINKFGFALMGFATALCFNIIFSAALDFMTSFSSSSTGHHQLLLPLPNITNSEKPFATYNNISISKKPSFCNSGSTSIILMADSFPLMVTKFIFAFYLIDFPQPMIVAASTSLLVIAFIILGFAHSEVFVLSAIVLISISIGISDPALISMGGKYGVRCLGGYALGTVTGAFVTSFLYAYMRMYMSVNSIMLCVLLMPILVFIGYAFIIKKLDLGSKQERVGLV